MQVEDFTDLSKVTTEKLMKLRDVAQDYYNEMQEAELEAWRRLQDIIHEIVKRAKNVQTSN